MYCGVLDDAFGFVEQRTLRVHIFGKPIRNVWKQKTSRETDVRKVRKYSMATKASFDNIRLKSHLFRGILDDAFGLVEERNLGVDH